MSAGLKALQYAEEVLGVHEVYEKAEGLIVELDAALADLDKALDDKRKFTEEIADREAELVSEMRGVHYDMTATEFYKRIKEWERSDDKLKELRPKLAAAQSAIQGVEFDIEILRARIRVTTARLNELGGYLYYLGVVKMKAEGSVNSNSKESSTA